MKLFGQGRAALADDPATAGRLGWSLRRRSLPEPEVILVPRSGDPHREPWIAPPWFDPALGLHALRRKAGRRRTWSYLAEVPGVLRCLARLAEPPPEKGWCIGVAGLGRVGGVAATLLAATPTGASGIRELVIHDADASNQERWLLELGSIARWRGRSACPVVRSATTRELFLRCDAFLFAATDSVPPPEARGEVRLVQFDPNRSILNDFLVEACAVDYAGLFLIVSDPVEWLAQAAFHDSNSDSSGCFTGS